MVLTLYGNLKHSAHIWSKSGIRFVKGIPLHRQSRQIHFFSEKTFLLHTCATYFELASYISTMQNTEFNPQECKKLGLDQIFDHRIAVIDPSVKT